MNFIDRPKPSKNYLAMILGVIAITAIPSLACLFLTPSIIGAIVAVVMLPLFGLLLETLHAAYATEYRIADGVLELRCGWIMKKRIALSEIRGVESVKAISRVLGWEPGATGYCNRLSNGLALKTAQGKVFISPSDLAAFHAALQPGGVLTVSGQAAILESPIYKQLIASSFIALGLLFVLLAIPLIAGIVPPNGVYGVRSAATLSSPENWYQANRFGGECLALAGVALTLGSIGLFRYSRKVRSTTVVMAGTAWTLVCTGAFFLLVLWNVSGLGDGAWTRPFVNDPEVIGAWESVDFVQAVENFTPEKKSWTSDLIFKGLTFRARGAASGSWRWTQGWIWNMDNRAEGQYAIKTINGTKYLFMEWINGDVLIRHERPWYYVMKPKD